MAVQHPEFRLYYQKLLSYAAVCIKLRLMVIYSNTESERIPTRVQIYQTQCLLNVNRKESHEPLSIQFLHLLTSIFFMRARKTREEEEDGTTCVES